MTTNNRQFLMITFVSSRPVATSHSHTFKTTIHELVNNRSVYYLYRNRHGLQPLETSIHERVNKRGVSYDEENRPITAKDFIHLWTVVWATYSQPSWIRAPRQVSNTIAAIHTMSKKEERLILNSQTYDPQALCCVYRSKSPGQTPKESPSIVTITITVTLSLSR